MKYRRVESFRTDFEQLPKQIQETVKQKFELFKQDPRHPSLRIKKMQGHDDIWEGHITLKIVFTFQESIDEETQETTIIFRRIGSHGIYDSP